MDLTFVLLPHSVHILMIILTTNDGVHYATQAIVHKQIFMQHRPLSTNSENSQINTWERIVYRKILVWFVYINVNEW
jgi:hypothetical protein